YCRRQTDVAHRTAGARMQLGDSKLHRGAVASSLGDTWSRVLRIPGRSFTGVRECRWVGDMGLRYRAVLRNREWGRCRGRFAGQWWGDGCRWNVVRELGLRPDHRPAG